MYFCLVWSRPSIDLGTPSLGGPECDLERSARTNMPVDTRLGAYANDVATLIATRDNDVAQLRIGMAMQKVNE